MLLMADETVIDEKSIQLIRGVVECWRTIRQRLLHLQMALPAMSLLDDIKDVKHVPDNAPSFLVLENHLRGPVDSFDLGLLAVLKWSSKVNKLA